MIITTGSRTDQVTTARAKTLAEEYQHPFIKRNKRSIDALFEKYKTDIATVGREKLTIMPCSSTEPIHFHPSLSMIRAKRLINGENDAFTEACRLTAGMSVLDCTMGLAADSIIASLVTGDKGCVTAVEASPVLHMLATEGLKTYHSMIPVVDEAMRRIKTVHADHRDYLRMLPDNSFDIVYFDPMFQETIKASNAIRKISAQAEKNRLTHETVTEAKRVAKHRVVLKDHWRSRRFEQFGFNQLKRKTSQVHYGRIEL
ncbi:class I SAM-dependent methyltransferase [Salinicoccus carnicancri]|uniref:class I SAM-dependent methyltransferase n=1 Tax=Salinicoccus carnicancri TaxID=558170 RepID=UPI0002F5BA85|nr:class I SAM-dependent methyltransferase [Salinicoccus carnicancri]